MIIDVRWFLILLLITLFGFAGASAAPSTLPQSNCIVHRVVCHTMQAAASCGMCPSKIQPVTISCGAGAFYILFRADEGSMFESYWWAT